MDVTKDFSKIAVVPNSGKPLYIFIHHTAALRSKNPDQWNATNNYHRDETKFDKSALGFYVGYNFEISANGTIRQSHPLGEQTCAQVAFNGNCLSICLDGDFDIEQPSEQQITALNNLLAELLKRYNLPATCIKGHRFVACTGVLGSTYKKNTSLWQTIDGTLPVKSCPGSNLTDAWIASLGKATGADKNKEVIKQVIALLQTLL